MQFKHPELLYALFLLLIPILIHLFQLRRFQKVDFTNVAFLKKVTIQTRKSSQLKKWLTLLARLLALTCLILAFAQPFTASKTAMNSEKEVVIYIDNSFSMQAKGANGPLLQRALQQLYEEVDGQEKLSWFTNNSTKKNVPQTEFKNEVLSIGYAQKQLSLEDILLKANQLFSNSKSANKRLILISDFQQKDGFPTLNNNIGVDVVEMKPVNYNNIAIDSAYIAAKNGTTTQLKVIINKQGEVPESIPISLNNDGKLIAKSAVDFSESSKNTISFDIENTTAFKGELAINDANLLFDNALYFSINTPKKIKVLSINEADTKFLQRLFDNDGYEYKQQPYSSLNYNDIPSQHFIILNEIKTIPTPLITALTAFSNGGGSVLVVPGIEINLESYNRLLSGLRLGTLNTLQRQEKKITNINFSHPLYENVFEKQVSNFQYPKVNSYYNFSSNATKVLSFEDSKGFILQKEKHFLSTASIDDLNSNFKNSPLIVPTLINMAQQSLPLPQLYYTIGEQNRFAVPIKLTQDEILTINDSVNSIIPLQQTKANSVELTTIDEPSTSGNYNIRKKEELIENLSYNYNRSESTLQYADLDNWEGIERYNSVSDLFESITAENKINSFWKWFVIFALLFLLVEMLLLKFLKN